MLSLLSFRGTRNLNNIYKKTSANWRMFFYEPWFCTAIKLHWHSLPRKVSGHSCTVKLYWAFSFIEAELIENQIKYFNTLLHQKSAFFSLYCPPIGVPKMPTASSSQIRRSAVSSTKQMAIRCPVFFTFLSISSQIRPVPNSSTAATTKSNSVHFTSLVNCMAINGINTRRVAVSRMPISLLFCIIINRLLFILNHEVTKKNLPLLLIRITNNLQTHLIPRPFCRMLCTGRR